MELDREDIAWKVVATAVGLAAAALVRWLLRVGWSQVRGGDPPDHPESPETTWGDAIAWAALTGLAVKVAEVTARRATAAGWERSRGQLPPSLVSEPQ